jgi:hypothetical protein
MDGRNCGITALARCCAVAAAGGLAGTAAATGGIWITPQELAALPMEGEAWDSLLETADEPAGTPDLSDQDESTDVRTLAKALVFARTGVPTYRLQVISTVMAAIGTEDGGRTLALGRNLVCYVIAADLVGLPPAEDATFRAWLDAVRYEDLDGKTLISTHEDRPNNWGTAAGASRMAAAIYLGDTADLAAAADVFKGWLGDRDAYDDFIYGELWWQSNPQEPVGINPAGAMIQGHSVDGVLPDDQRRGGPFEWPPPQENYVYTGLQGAVVQAEILHRQGYDAWNWENKAMLRAFQWLHEQANYPAVGDDTWQPHIVNYRYGTSFPAPVPSNWGKNMGWTDWTHALGCPCDVNADSVVDQSDVDAVFADWGCSGECAGDVNGDQVVDVRDHLFVLQSWGDCAKVNQGISAPGSGPGPRAAVSAVAAAIRNPFALWRGIAGARPALRAAAASSAPAGQRAVAAKPRGPRRDVRAGTPRGSGGGAPASPAPKASGGRRRNPNRGEAPPPTPTFDRAPGQVLAPRP